MSQNRNLNGELLRVGYAMTSRNTLHAAKAGQCANIAHVLLLSREKQAGDLKIFRI